jgi:methylmalonyl-CoA mutase
MAAESLLAMFPAVPTEQWERIIRESAPGSEYAAKLIWHPEEGLAVRPYYRAEDLAGLKFVDAPPGAYPYVRGTRSEGGWRIREVIEAVDSEQANCAAIEALAAGAEYIAFRGARIESESDLALLFANLHEIPIRVETASQNVVRLLRDRLKKRPHGAEVSADLDPLLDCEFSAETIRDSVPRFRPFVVDAGAFHESGVGAIEEVGFALSAAVDFLAEMQQRGVEVDRAVASMSFGFAMGPEFFIQIAKLRAFRMVWAHAVESFGGSCEAAKAVIYAHPAYWDKAIYDRHVNVLRATTEALSAVLGGADSIAIAPFDQCCRPPDESSRRLARNTQIIFRREALLDRVADPVGGSYMIEALTNSIAAKGWKLFQELEGVGGFRKAMAAGIVPAVLKRRTRARDEAFALRRRVLTGINRFAETTEKAAEFEGDARESGVPRAAAQFEQLRRRTERHARRYGRLPHIVLAEIGDAKMRIARSQFAADFLACAGLAGEARHFESVDEIAACNAELLVLCSSDAEYLALAEDLMPMLDERESRMKVIVAGNPETAEQLKSQGVIGLIHMRSNAVEVLTALLRELGIKD